MTFALLRTLSWTLLETLRRTLAKTLRETLLGTLARTGRATATPLPCPPLSHRISLKFERNHREKSLKFYRLLSRFRRAFEPSSRRV
jgi:hypothetical protein